MINHAPRVNFVSRDDDVTMPETTAPLALITKPVLPLRLALGEVVLGHAGLRQRERREHADRVERDQPVDLGAGDEQQHDRRRPARKMIPFENTRRWPRLVSWRGMKLSSAWNDARRGKSAKLVFAASTRMSIVPACSDR